eukprot:6583771-Prymnesium_polylepis.1
MRSPEAFCAACSAAAENSPASSRPCPAISAASLALHTQGSWARSRSSSSHRHIPRARGTAGRA